MNKNVILPTLALGVVATAAGIFAANTANAGNGFGGDQEVIVENLASKLGVEESKVNEAMSSIREERRTEMQSRQDEKLGEAVSAGVITEDQKNQIIEKRNAFRAEMTEQRQAHKDEMQKWMSEQGIDHDKLQEYMGGGMGKGGFGRGMHR